eukprot:CAMPEP_0194227528 /NCGR_PEP_ID=MMETSP0156-20130528/42904_1 /TAXON_ID=33649 /ORGANISM="Thalassionema nitzschioides, Strain L26-B" /LENGTH=668 /DNA_ID=CAMNT_0038960015 /DNA_START=96 /DNA_END=2102 /DNA_ORIENTATION=+
MKTSLSFVSSLVLLSCAVCAETNTDAEDRFLQVIPEGFKGTISFNAAGKGVGVGKGVAGKGVLGKKAGTNSAKKGRPSGGKKGGSSGGKKGAGKGIIISPVTTPVGSPVVYYDDDDDDDDIDGDDDDDESGMSYYDDGDNDYYYDSGEYDFAPCSVCGPGSMISIPEGLVNFGPNRPTAACQELQNFGFDGMIPPTDCAALPDFIKNVCGCTDTDGDSDNEDNGGTGCSVCGDGRVVYDGDAVFKYPNRPEIKCMELQGAGLGGFISLQDCEALPSLIENVCACGGPEYDDSGDDDDDDDDDDDYYYGGGSDGGYTSCSACGPGRHVTEFDSTIQFPDMPVYTCGYLEFAGAAGILTEDECLIIPTAIDEACGCADDDYNDDDDDDYPSTEHCSVCGEGREVTNPDAIFDFPDQPSVKCGALESAGWNALLYPSECEDLPDLIDLLCECQDVDAPIYEVDPESPCAGKKGGIDCWDSTYDDEDGKGYGGKKGYSGYGYGYGEDDDDDDDSDGKGYGGKKGYAGYSGYGYGGDDDDDDASDGKGHGGKKGYTGYSGYGGNDDDDDASDGDEMDGKGYGGKKGYSGYENAAGYDDDDDASDGDEMDGKGYGGKKGYSGYGYDPVHFEDEYIDNGLSDIDCDCSDPECDCDEKMAKKKPTPRYDYRSYDLE